MEINEPAVLVRLPRSQIEGGRTFVSQVCSLSNGLKRKRQELCAAIDGDSINIYEINQGRTLSSYSIPPDSALLCPPCSIRSKTQSGTKFRTTYFATDRRGQTSLSVFEEKLDDNVRNSTSKCLAIGNISSPIIQLEVLPRLDAHLLLAVKEDGCFEIYDAEQKLRNYGKLYGMAPEARLVTVQWLSSAQALKSVLRSRPDIVATSESDCSFIVGVFGAITDKHTGNLTDIELGIWQLPKTDAKSSHEISPGLTLRHKLAVTSPLVQRDRDPVVFTAKETRLTIRTQSRLVVFDVTKLVPSKVQETVSTVTDHVSSISISDALILSSTPSALLLQNTQFQTLQAKLDLTSSNLKRKRNFTPGGPIVFVAYFPALNRFIANRRHQLVAIDITTGDADAISVALRQTSLLISNIGRGAISHDYVKNFEPSGEASAGRQSKYREQIEQWNSTFKQLESYLREKSYTKFEELALEHAIGKPTKSPTESHIISNYKVDYVISKIFELETKNDEVAHTSFAIFKSTFQTPKLLEALALKGFLTPERVGKVLRGLTKSSYEPLQYGNTSQILIDNDPSLGLFRRVLEGSPHISYKELCAAILLLLRRALEESGAMSSLATVSMLPASSDQLTSLNAISTLSKATEVVPLETTSSLCTAIERLAETAQGVLAKHMHNTFSQGEIIALIQFLRQQLFRGGHTRSLQAQILPSPPQSDDGLDGSSNLEPRNEVTISAISTVLSSCIDAIGPVGVLGFGDDEEFVQSLIPELSSEISKAAEALQDAAYLEGILRETLRFGESMTRSQGSATVQENGHVVSQHKSGAILTIYAEPATDSNVNQSSSALPLSLRAEGKISTTKIRKGDGKKTKRSEREMGMHQDRLRGPYALERLIL